MSTTLLTITPVAVGTNPQVPNIAFSATDWLEVKNDSPFAVTVTILGVTSNSFFLTPFEHNGWPIQQLLQTSQLKVNNLSLVVTPSHYYSNVATENNSPTNICTVNLLSQQEAQTNTYPLYTARMNTTVSTIANYLNNTGNPPAQIVAFAAPQGDNNAAGAWNVNNQGQEILGDSLYNGILTVLGTVLTSQVNLQKDLLRFIFNNKLVDFSGQYTLINGDTSGNIQLFETIKGSAKLSIILENSYVSGQKTISLLSNYSTASLWMSGNIGLSGDGGYQVTNGGITQNFDVFNGLNVAGGTTTNQANIFRFSFAHQKNAFDTLVVPTRTTSKIAATFIIGQ